MAITAADFSFTYPPPFFFGGDKWKPRYRRAPGWSAIYTWATCDFE